MSRGWTAAFGIVMFVVGAYASPHLTAGQQRDRGKTEEPARALLPELPVTGRSILVGSEPCRVMAVVQEWVQCDRERSVGQMWRNLYNGASYAVSGPFQTDGR